MDDESLSILRSAAAEPLGIPSGLHHRLRGESIGELRDDAKRLAQEIGLVEPPQRDEQGRFTARSMNDVIRQAAGR